MSRQQLKKYIFIIDAVRSAGERGVTLEELNEKWKRSYRNDSGKPIPWRTFIDDRDAIAELFGIEITCDKRDNTYRIGGGWDEYGSVKDTLIDAKYHPEKYPTLMVRVAGYSVYFTDIAERVQNDIIARNENRM